MLQKFPGFIGGSYQSESRAADGERLINWYIARIEPPDPRFPWGLFPTPGVVDFASATDAPGRGMLEVEGRVFVVLGSVFYELTLTGSVGAHTNRGAVLLDDNPAQLCTSGDISREVMIVSGGAAYIYHLDTDVFTALGGGSSPGMNADLTHWGFMDGVFIALDPSTSTFRVSDLADGLTWGALSAQQRSQAPDRWISMLVVGHELWLFGSLTTEVWQFAGTVPVPFQPIEGANLEFGSGAAFAASVLGSPIWLQANKDGGGMVLQATGYTARRVSDHALEAALQSYTTTSDAVGWTYQQHGHLFYVLSLADAGATWVYDAATQRWHQRDYLHVSDPGPHAWRPRHW